MEQKQVREEICKRWEQILGEDAQEKVNELVKVWEEEAERLLKDPKPDEQPTTFPMARQIVLKLDGINKGED